MKNLFLIILVISGFVSCAKNAEESEFLPEAGNIYGVVTVKATAEPLRATGVELYIPYYSNSLDRAELIHKTVTYDDGHFEFNDLKPQVYAILIVANGYQDAMYRVRVEAGRTAHIDMQLEKIDNHMTVQTLGVTALSYNSVQFNGEYTYKTSTETPNEVGFLYSQSQSDIANGKRLTGTIKSQGYAVGDFYVEAKNLAVGTWYVLAYATNKYGTQYGEIQYFEINGQPSVTTLDATNVAETTATLNGRIEYEGDPAYTERGFVYSSSFSNPTIDDPATATTKVVVSGTSKEFSANIAGLKDNTTYYVRAYAINSTGVVYGEAIEFFHRDYIELKSDGIMVHKYDISSGADWVTANNLCRASKLGGYSGWRLPNISECRALNNSYDSLNLTPYTYWTTEVYPSLDNYYYAYSFARASGSTSYSKYTTTYRVRCVRTL